MAKFDEVFGAYNSQKQNTWRARKRRFDEVFGRVETPAEAEPEREFGGILDTLGRIGATTFTGIEGALGSGLKAAGAEFAGIADGADRRNPDANSGALYRKVGELMSGAGNYFEGRAFSPERQKALRAQEWNEIPWQDIISDPEKLSRYLTDPNGALADVGYNFGNALYFATLAKLFPGGAAAGIAEKALNPASKALGVAGLGRASQALSSNTAKELLGNALQFSSTMGLAGALTNGGLIVDELKAQGYSPEEIQGILHSMYAEELPADIAFASATGNVMKGMLGRLAPRGSSTWRKALTNAATGIPLEVGGGYYSNLNQAILADKYSGKDYGTLLNPTLEESNLGFQGAIGALPFAAHGAYRGTKYANIRDQIYEQEHEEPRRRSKEFADAYHGARERVPELAVEAYRKAQEENNLTAKQAETWDAAQYASARAKEKFGYDIAPELIYKQWAHEAGTNFDSENARYNNNFGGLTQTEPNGEENKQPDGGNYYRHFNNVREYADAYVDDFIKYYPEISGAKNEREFASVLKKYGYFGDSLENYATSMEGISAPSSRTSVSRGNVFGTENYDMPAAQMESSVDALKAGWKEVIPQIGGVLKNKFGFDPVLTSAARTREHQNRINPDAPNSYHIINEEGGDAIDISLSEGELTPEQEQAVLDYFKSTGLFSEVLYHSVVGGKHLHLGGLNTEALKTAQKSVGDRADEIFAQSFQDAMRPQEQPQAQAEEQAPKPLFDINGEDEATQKLFERFANERRNSETGKDFFAPMFENDEFQNTPENRDAIRDRYPKTFDAWATNLFSEEKQPQTNQPTQQTPTKQAPKQDTGKSKGDPLITTARLHLEQLRKGSNQDKALVTLQLNNALNTGNRAEIEKILKQEGVTVPTNQESTPTENNPVQETKSPKPKASPTTKKIKTASAQVKTGSKQVKSRKKQGAALISLAAENNIEIPQAEVIALTNGSTRAVQKWRDNLMKAGVFDVAVEQEPVQEKTPAPKSTPTPKQTEIDTIQAEEDAARVKDVDRARENWERIKQNAQERGETVRQQRRQESRQRDDERYRQMEEKARQIAEENSRRYDEIVKEKAERDRRAEQQKRESAFREKQDRELQELQTRQAEAARLRERAARTTAETQKEFAQRHTLKEDISRALTPPSENKSERVKQGNHIADLIASKPFSDMFPRVSTPPGLNTALKNGDTKAIQKAQEIFSNAEVRPVDWADPSVQESKVADAERINEVRTFQADEQARQAEEQFHRKQREQSQQAGVEAQRGLAQSTIESLNRQRYNIQADTEEPVAEESTAREESLTERKPSDDTGIKSSVNPETLIYPDKFSAKAEPKAETSAEGKRPPQSSNPKPKTGISADETSEQTPSRTTEEKLSKRQWNANKKILQAMIKSPQITWSDKDILDFLLKMTDAMETKFKGDNSWQSGKNFHSMDALQVNVERVTGDYKNSHSGGELRSYLNGITARDGQQEIYYSGTHDLDNFSISPYALEKTIEREIKRLEGRIQRDKLPSDAQKYLELYADEARAEQQEKAARSAEENKPETKIRKLQEEIAHVEEYLEDSKVRLEEAKSSPYGSVRLWTKEIQRSQNNLERLNAQLKELQAELPVEKNAEEKRAKVAEEKSGDEIDGVVGRADEVWTSTDGEYPVRYKVVEIDDVIGSTEVHEQGGVFKNLEYEKRGGIQPRDRQSKEMEQRLNQQIKEFRPKRLLSLSESVNTGTPVIRKDGVVFNGNGRIAMLEHIYRYKNTPAYEGRNGKAYKELLMKKADSFGVNADEIADMNRPVLVRELTGELSRKELADIAGTTEGGAAKVADEKALADAEKIRPETLAKFPKGNVDLSEQADKLPKVAKEFLQDVLLDVATNDEYVALVNNGEVTDEGADRAVNALFALAYPDKNLVKMASVKEDNIKRIVSALKNAAAEFAKVRAGIEDGSLDKYNLNDITDAAVKLSALRDEGKKVKDYLDEGKFDFAKDRLAFRETLAALDAFANSKEDLTNFLQELARRIQAGGQNPDGMLFAVEPTPIEDFVKEAREFAEKQKAIRQAEAKEKKRAQKTKHDKTGDADVSFGNVVEEKKLTPQQKLLKSFGDKLGVETIFVDNPDSKFHGAFSNGKIYLNANSQKPLDKVFWHESMHWLKANNPALYKALAKAANITDAQRDAYIERTERDDLMTDDAIDEEILSDAMEDTAKRTGLLQDIAGKNRGLIQRVVQWLKDIMNKFVDHFRNPDGKLTTKQAQALAGEFGRIAKDLVDADGQKIFRHNRNTNNIELADGRKLSDVRESEPQMPIRLAADVKYSIGNDNSNESLFQKIKSRVSSLFDKSSPAKRRNVRITEALSKLTGCRVAFGHMQGDDTIIDDFHKVIRSPHAYEWETLLPKIGGKIAQGLGIANPTQEMSNYVADWLLTGALNNTTPEATQFQKAMRNNPAMSDLMLEVRDIFQEVADMSPSERILSKVVTPQKASLFSRRDFKEQWTDDLHPLKRAFDKIIEKADPQVAAFMKEHVNPYELSRLLRGMGGLANLMIDTQAKNIDKLRASLQDQYPFIDFSEFQSMNMIIDSVGGDIDGLQAYAIAKLDKEIHEKNREKNPDGTAKYKYVKPTYSEADADAIIKAGEKKFGDAQKALVHYSKTMLKMLYASGVISQGQYIRISGKWQNYIPMARVFDEHEERFEIDPLETKTGSDRDVYAPINTIIANTQEILRRCESNKVRLEIATVARCGGFGEIFSEIDKPSPNDGTVLYFKENGKQKYLQTPDLSIVRAVENIYQKQDGAWVMKFLKASMNLIRNWQTVLNPDFIAGNPFRDVADAYIHNQYAGNPITAFLDVWFKGLKGVVKRDADFHDWMANGGSQSAFVSEDVDYTQRSIDDITGGTTGQRLRKKPFRTVLDTMQKISEYAEYATRLSNYKQAVKKLAAQRADGKATVEDKKRAALESRNASIDFAKAGTSMRKVNQVVLFSNAAVQGWTLDAKTFNPMQLKTAERRKKLFAATFRLAMMGIMPFLLQSAYNNSDDERRKLYENRPQWEKDTYWIFGNVRIPKGVDVGIRLLSTLTEQFMSDNPVELSRIGKTLKDSLPSILPTIIAPAFETWANYSFFRDAPIVPYKEQKLPDRLQYGANTSAVAKGIGDITGLSPRKMDYLISGYLGFIGKFLSRTPDYLSGNRALGVDEIPVVRRFMFDPYKNPKAVQDYYEQYSEQEKLLAGYKLEREQGKKPQLPEGYDAALHKRLKAANEQMRKLSKLEKKLLEDPKLTNDQREKKLRELEQRRLKLAEKALGRAR